MISYELRVTSCDLSLRQNKFMSSELLFTRCSVKRKNLRVAQLLYELKLKTYNFKK